MKYSIKNKLPFIQNKVCSTHPLQTTQRWFCIFRSQLQFPFTKRPERIHDTHYKYKEPRKQNKTITHSMQIKVLKMKKIL